MATHSAWSRRQFVRGVAGAAIVGPTILAFRGRAQPAVSPNDRINLGFIGVGTMGRYHLRSFLGKGQVQVVAVCDVVAERREDAQRLVDEYYSADRAKGTYRG